MVTIRQIATCAGVFAAPISVRTLFGTQTPPLSVLTHAATKTQTKIDLNIIVVGWEAFVPAGLGEIEAAVQQLRQLYASVDLGIGKIAAFMIPLDEAEGHEDIDSSEEADAVQAEWGFAGMAIDVFFVRTWAGAVVGRSPINGPCPENAEPESGLVVAIEHSTDITANTLAHELGHYLGLLHHADENNLMFKNVPNGQQLTGEQGQRMRTHCMVRTGCRGFPT
jgi:hypothetical protein